MRGCKDKSHTAQLVSGVAEPDAARDVETAAVRGDGAVVGGGDSGAGAVSGGGVEGEGLDDAARAAGASDATAQGDDGGGGGDGGDAAEAMDGGDGMGTTGGMATAEGLDDAARAGGASDATAQGDDLATSTAAASAATVPPTAGPGAAPAGDAAAHSRIVRPGAADNCLQAVGQDIFESLEARFSVAENPGNPSTPCYCPFWFVNPNLLLSPGRNVICSGRGGYS